MNPYDWLNKFYNYYTAANLRIEACCRNQPNKSEMSLAYESKMSLYKSLL